MPNPFQGQVAASSAAVDAAYGETLRFIPWHASQYGKGAADGARHPVNLIGTLIGSRGGMGGEPGAMIVHGTRYICSFDRSRIDAVDWPRESDRVQALERPGQPLFQIVTAPEGDGFSRVYFDVVVL